MPLSYDDIQQGRRREWDKLRSPEERKEREREEREKLEQDPDYVKRMTALQKRDKRREDEREQDRRRWGRTKRDVTIIAAITLGIILFMAGVSWSVRSAVQASRDERARQVIQALVEGGRYASFSDPFETWGSWMNGWMRRDAASIYRTYSESMALRTRGSLQPEAYIADLQRQLTTGQKDHIREIAEKFGHPEILHIPGGKPRKGEMAVFRSRPMYMRAVAASAPQRWVLAMTWDDKLKEWRVEELRHENSWNDSWKYTTQIAGVRDMESRSN